MAFGGLGALLEGLTGHPLPPGSSAAHGQARRRQRGGEPHGQAHGGGIASRGSDVGGPPAGFHEGEPAPGGSLPKTPMGRGGAYGSQSEGFIQDHGPRANQTYFVKDGPSGAPQRIYDDGSHANAQGPPVARLGAQGQGGGLAALLGGAPGVAAQHGGDAPQMNLRDLLERLLSGSRAGG